MKTMLAALIGVVALTAAGCHRGGHHGMAKNPERAKKYLHSHVEEVLEDLDATEAQKSKVFALEDKLFQEGLAIHGGTREAHQELLAQFKSPAPDAARMHALVDARAEAYRKFAHQLVDASVEVHSTLTPEQRARLEKKLARFEKRMGH